MEGSFDTHAHYYDGRFEREAEGGADSLLRQIMPEPVSMILNVGTNPQTSRLAVAQAAEYEGMYAAVGIHPEDCHYVTDAEEALQEIRDMVSDPARCRGDKILAIGEIGLDYHWQDYNGIPMGHKRCFDGRCIWRNINKADNKLKIPQMGDFFNNYFIQQLSHLHLRCRAFLRRGPQSLFVTTGFPTRYVRMIYTLFRAQKRDFHPLFLNQTLPQD